MVLLQIRIQGVPRGAILKQTMGICSSPLLVILELMIKLILWGRRIKKMVALFASSEGSLYSMLCYFLKLWNVRLNL